MPFTSDVIHPLSYLEVGLQACVCVDSIAQSLCFLFDEDQYECLLMHVLISS